MEDGGEPPHFKRERQQSAYGQPPTLHMPPADAPSLHNYHHPTPQSAQMPPTWNPAPSPYHDGHDHRPPPVDGPAHQQSGPYPPHHNYPPHHHSQPPPPTPNYPPDLAYSRQGSNSGPTRSPSGTQAAHYPPPVNGAPPPDAYYPPADYRSRPPYAPLESPGSAPQPPPLHVQTTNHEMMPAQPQPQGPPQSYPQPYSAGPPPSTPQHWGQPYSDWQQQQRRKPVRAAQACDSCRQRKAKCDEGRPECTHCKENQLRCTYRDVPPQKSEKQMLQMGEKVDALNEKLDTYIKTNEEQLNKFLNSIQTWFESRIGEQKFSGSLPMTKTRSRPHTKEEPRSSPWAVDQNINSSINAPFYMGQENIASGAYQLGPPTDSSNVNKKGRGPMGASDLLSWPSIKEITPPNIPITYVMDSEVQRGLLRLYGCGEGEDKGDGHDGIPSPAASSTSARMDEDSTTSSPSGVWGTGQLPHREGNQYSVHDHPGGVTPNGQLLLTNGAVDKYVRGYLEHMHILHPFLDPRVLRRMVHNFKRKHSWDYPNVSGRLVQSVVGSKRKRDTSESPNSMTDEPPHSQPVQQHNGTRIPARNVVPIEHSVSNAIILLVIALGKICLHEAQLPGPPKSQAFATASQPANPHLGYGDLPPMPSTVSAPASPYSIPHTNGLTASTGVSYLHGKNMDVIPGLAYYAKAADILGELPGGVDVSHIQANLLAGLYMGQLARVVSSHWYIANACRACQILIRSADYKEKKMMPERRNLINFAFWSCLQLESDILAEMDIPASGIVQKEASMLQEIPTALTVADPEREDAPSNAEEFLRHYSNQIQLRRTLNDAVHNIYTVDRDQEKPTKLIETIGENLESWRTLLHEWDWDDDHHKHEDINHARMRAKYYGAKYIINRPALHYALNQSYPGTPMSRPSESPVAAASFSEHTSPAMTHHGQTVPTRRVTEMRPPGRTSDQLEEWIIGACGRCVRAAVRSTTVFDRVPGRLVITNILGTAHAQFGNVLVLAATFNSPNRQLKELVNEQELKYLLHRTIKFLEARSAISPALGQDAKILHYVRNKLFPGGSGTYPGQQLASATSSFSSDR